MPTISTDEQIKKSEDESVTKSHPVVVAIKGFERKEDGSIMFSIEENSETKLIRLEDIEKHHPKQLAQYLYDLLISQ
jgi:hypothetical protein